MALTAPGNVGVVMCFLPPDGGSGLPISRQ